MLNDDRHKIVENLTTTIPSRVDGLSNLFCFERKKGNNSNYFPRLITYITNENE